MKRAASGHGANETETTQNKSLNVPFMLQYF